MENEIKGHEGEPLEKGVVETFFLQGERKKNKEQRKVGTFWL